MRVAQPPGSKAQATTEDLTETLNLIKSIDETDQDLLDFCDALDIPTQLYRVKKFIVNGRPEY